MHIPVILLSTVSPNIPVVVAAPPFFLRVSLPTDDSDGIRGQAFSLNYTLTDSSNTLFSFRTTVKHTVSSGETPGGMLDR